MAEVVLNEFELQRQQLIARNRARLLALGIPEAVSGLAKLAPKQAQHKKRKTPQAAAKTAAEPAAPSRQSTRLRDQAMVARGEVPPDVEQGSELALFIIDGECPRCGKVLSSSHARHLQSCKGPPEPPTEEEIAAQAESYKLQQKDKLCQLELGGLVDYQPASSSSEQQQQQQPPLASVRVLPKEVHMNAVSLAVENFRLMFCPPDRLVTVETPVKIWNADIAPGVKAGGWLHVVNRKVPLLCEGWAVRPYLELDVRNMRVKDVVRFRDVPLPQGCKLKVKDPLQPVVRCAARVGGD